MVFLALNRLTRATVGGQVSGYVYDDQGRGIQKTVAGTATNLLLQRTGRRRRIYGHVEAADSTIHARAEPGRTDRPRQLGLQSQYFHRTGWAAWWP